MEIVCPYCGETIEIALDEGAGSTQRYIEDCSVCCRPIELAIDVLEDGEISAVATRADD